jgi:hypothetical protein
MHEFDSRFERGCSYMILRILPGFRQNLDKFSTFQAPSFHISDHPVQSVAEREQAPAFPQSNP